MFQWLWPWQFTDAHKAVFSRTKMLVLSQGHYFSMFCQIVKYNIQRHFKGLNGNITFLTWCASLAYSELLQKESSEINQLFGTILRMALFLKNLVCNNSYLTHILNVKCHVSTIKMCKNKIKIRGEFTKRVLRCRLSFLLHYIN